jgi:hypothetical protein
MMWENANHCGASGCKCTHTGPCVKGWLETNKQNRGYEQIVGNTRESGTVEFADKLYVEPCAMCFPSLKIAVNKSKSQQELSARARKRPASVTVEQEYMDPEYN